MIQKIENVISLKVKSRSCKGLLEPIDLSKASNILLVIKQKFGYYIELTAELKEDSIVAVLPYKEAMKLTDSSADLQLMWTDENGNKRATNVKTIPVQELLKEAGYD